MQQRARAVMSSFTSDTSSLKVLTHLVNAVCLPPERVPFRHCCEVRVHALPELRCLDAVLQWV